VGQNGLCLAVTRAHRLDNLFLHRHHPVGGDLARGGTQNVLNRHKLALRQARCDGAAYIAIGDLAHAPPERIAEETPFIDNGLPLVEPVAGEAHSLLRKLGR
jgi:hypothetical protein